MKLKKLLLFSLSLVFALSLTFGLGGAFKAAADGKTGTKLFTGAHVSLTEDIVTKFEYTATAGYTSASYTFTYMGKTTEEKTATVKEGENTIEFAEANPARIGETIIANLTLTGEGKEPVTDTCEFSVANYLGTLLTAAPSTFTEIKTQEQYVAMRTLAANLVNYSAKTQEYIGLADTSSSLLTTETVKNFVGSMEPNGTDANVGPLTETAKYGFLGASLLLDGRVSVCFYFVAESTENLTLEIAFDGGSTATLTEIVAAPEIAVKEGVTAYKAVLEGIPAIDMDKTFTAKLLSNGTVVGNEVTYSVKSYAYAMLSSDNAKMKSLATAIYNYGLSAKSYVEVMAKDYSVDLPTRTETGNLLSSNTYPVKQNVSKIYGWGNIAGTNYGCSVTTDGEYLYMLAYPAVATKVSEETTKNENGETEVTSSEWKQNFRIVKMSIAGEVLGYSASYYGATKKCSGTAYQYEGLEYYTPLWIKDGYAYSYNGEGQTIRIAVASLTGNNVAYEVASDIKFGDNEASAVSAVVYSATQKKYAVIANGNLAIYGETDLTTAVGAQSAAFNVRIGADDNNIYAITSSNGNYAPNATVYDWNAKKCLTIKIANDRTVMGATTEAGAVNTTDSESRTKPQGLTVVGGSIYFQLIGWQNKTMNSFSAYKVTAVERTINDYAVGDIIENYEYEMSAKSLTNGWNGNTLALIINATVKNDWVYSVRSEYKADGICRGYLIRYNYLDNVQTVVSPKIDNIKIGSENSAIFTYGDRVYLYDKGNAVWKSLPLLFTEKDTWETVNEENPLPISLGSYASSFENIYVFEDLKITAVFSGSKIALLNYAGGEIASYAVVTAAKNRMGGGKNGYLYYTANKEHTLNPVVTVINVKTGEKKTVTLPNTNSSAANTAVTSIFELNGTLCYSMFTWSNWTSTIQSVSFSNTCFYEKPYKEAVEMVSDNSEFALEATETVIASIGGTVKGVVTDGMYLYMANCTTTGKVKILKTTKYGVLLGQTAEFDNGVVASETNAAFNDKTYLLYKDGYVYAYGVRFNGKVYRVKADDIVVGTDVEVEASALPFNGVTKAEAIAYDEKNDRYAVRVGRALYLVDGKTNSVYKTVEGAAVTGTEVGVAADENYVYVLTELTGGIRFYVYDWSGNKIGEVSQAGFIKEESKNANIPSMLIEGGKVYIFAKPWAGAYASKVIIYTIDLNKLAG